ncbi:hypothetical protein KR215_009967 [Drosophila sulfurigaster]|nr:hypothetical protein KR215_009967 [Drosophila sulfurigaster]
MLRTYIICFALVNYLVFEAVAFNETAQQQLLNKPKELDRLLDESIAALDNEQVLYQNFTRRIENRLRNNQRLLHNKTKLEEHLLNIIRDAPQYHNNIWELTKHVRKEFKKIDGSHHWHCIVGPKIYHDFANSTVNHVFVTWEDKEVLLVNVKRTVLNT